MIFRPAAWTIVAVVVAATPALSSAQDSARALRLSFDADGRVTLAAQNVAVRDILAEWARQCGCYVVNADRLSGAPDAVPIAFAAARQADVLRALLRQSAGYVFTPKRLGGTGPSDYETIYVVPGAAPPASPVFTRFAPSTTLPIASIGAPDDEIPPVIPVISDAAALDATPITSPPGMPPPSAGGLPGFVVTPILPVGPAPPRTTVTVPRPGTVTPQPGTP